VSAAVVAFVGRSGSGKTTLITRLVPVLTGLGIRVGIVKHSPVHPVETDVTGQDTHRFWMSGARHVTLVGQDRVVHAHRFEAEPALPAVLAGMHDVDLILLEGYKRSEWPKIEVIRRAHDPQPIEGLRGRIAVVTDVEELAVDCARFQLDQVRELALFLVGCLGGEGAGGALG
jgi:molybdopterin-guanine dinucleotide biosynthesis adapter protein